MVHRFQEQLDVLEAESIYLFREAVAQCERPVLLYSMGKDSSVLLHLAQKAFTPATLPFPVLHIDTGFKFAEMISFRDRIAREHNLQLIVEKNVSAEAQALTPLDAHTDHYVFLKKTKPLLDALARHKFDCAIGGARRDEEKSRAKERIFSVRGALGAWDPKDQRPELWHVYNLQLQEGDSMRAFPLSNWTEVDIWQYIARENIEISSLYFAKKRLVFQRNGLWLRVDEYAQPGPSEAVEERWCRYRTLGCSPSTGVVFSQAQTLEEVIEEVLESDSSERITRAIDKTSEASMEKKKREGYF